jgi:hypothetical protein
LNFPAIRVEYLVDNRGDSYKQGQDFALLAGQIMWLPGGRRPAPDLETGRGAIISVRYYYRPFWLVSRLLHEIRVSQVENILEGTSSLIRMPQQALLNREFLYLSESNDPEAKMPNSPRQQQAPEDGGFGPR